MFSVAMLKIALSGENEHAAIGTGHARRYVRDGWRPLLTGSFHDAAADSAMRAATTRVI